MRKFALPLVAVLLGVALSWGLQALDVAPLLAKASGLALAVGVIVVDWMRKART